MMKAGCAMDILFKPRVEATEEMVENCMDISQPKNQRETCIITVTYAVVVINCFNFILRLKTQVK